LQGRFTRSSIYSRANVIVLSKKENTHPCDEATSKKKKKNKKKKKTKPKRKESTTQ